MRRNGYKIEYASKKDVNEIIKIETESSGSWEKDFFLSEFNNILTSFIVAKNNNDVVAFAISSCIIDEIHISKIAVSKLHLRKGIGTALIQFVVENSKYENLKKIILEVNEKNLAAVLLYNNLGFQKIGNRKNYYPNDNAIIMEKNLE